MGYFGSFGILPSSQYQFHWWQGLSGLWYVHTVLPLHQWRAFDSMNYILTRSRYDGLFDPLYIGETGDGQDRVAGHEKLEPALQLGATHVHVHLLAETRYQRLAIETDLRHRHPTPLNKQGIGALGLL